MTRFHGTLMAIAFACLANTGIAQNLREREEDFLKAPPHLGTEMPSVQVYTSDGKAFDTSQIKGHYTVLTFGCLTCPPSMWNIAGLEAVQRDYGPKGVKFYFIYKALAHPELAGNYVHPFTIEERVAQAQQAIKQFGTQIPWLVDAMDNRLKHALGDRPNSQFLIAPDGKIVRKRAWSNPIQVRKDLEELVGSVDHITKVEDLKLELGLPLEPVAARGVVKRYNRLHMLPVQSEPQIKAGGTPFYAKLRAEADQPLITQGKGEIYLGFHLDPFHRACWNNLKEPLTYHIDAPSSVKIEKPAGAADRVSVPSDTDPREFVLKVSEWPADEAIRITVSYVACLPDETCVPVKQEYVVRRIRDMDGGGARGDGAGFWDKDEFNRRLLMGDRNRDGKLTLEESVGLVQPHFETLDRNHDGVLDTDEMSVVTDWLNHHHKPGVPKQQ